MADHNNGSTIQALIVNQWLTAWNEIHWDPSENRSQPPHWFYQFNLSATALRRLSGVYARTIDRSAASADFGIQRKLNRHRSVEIGEFVRFGYPWSDLSEKKRKSPDFRDLRQPGWLPTSVVVNILTSGDERCGNAISECDLISVCDGDDGTATLHLPCDCSDANWTASGVPPIEVIDGQHRLWAFEEFETDNQYELPVVAFVGLDLSWQAYLFYIINIKPKKINASLAFDLYPLLRTEQWLEKFEGHSIYRETRSQELVDKLWSHRKSPWHHRINMLGESGSRGLMVTQAAWVRSLMASFVKRWEDSERRLGGLFGAKVGSHQLVLPWTLVEQAAFLIFIGRMFQNAVNDSTEDWCESLRAIGGTKGGDPAFIGTHNLLNQDQGIRTFLQVFNDMLFFCDELIQLGELNFENDSDNMTNVEQRISSAIEYIEEVQLVVMIVGELSTVLASYDWRASSHPHLTTEQRLLKASFRGSGGYRELRKHILGHIANSGSSLDIAAKEVLNILGYSK